jgi:hypothetical protein
MAARQQRLVSAVIILALLAATLTVQSPEPGVQRDSVNPEPVILDVRIGSIASTTVSALRIGDRAILPITPVLVLAGLHATKNTPSRYVSTDSLAELLDAAIIIDWDDLTATISDDGTLPVSRRAMRQERRDLFNATNAMFAARSALTRPTPLLPHGFIADYGVTTPSAITFAQPGLSLTLGSTVLGGGLDVGWSRVDRASLVRPAISWERIWPERPWIRYVRIGSAPFTPGSVVRSGLLVSNRPLPGNDDTDPVVLAGVPGRDWEVEAYRDGILVYAGIVDSTGAYMLSLPGSRGTNAFAVTAYGPDGEQRMISRYVSIGNDVLPAGTGSYSAAIGTCAAVRCDRAANLSLHYAPDSHLTAGADFSAFTGACGLVLRPAASVSARVRDDMNTSVRYGHDGAAADFRYAPSADFDVVAAYRSTAFNPITEGLSTRRSSAVATVVWRPPGWAHAIDATANLAGSRLADEQRVRVASSLLLGAAYIRPFMSLARRVYMPSPTLGFGAYAETNLPRLIRTIVPMGSHIRGAVALGDDRSGDTFVALAIPFMHAARIEVAASWGSVKEARTPQVNLSMSLIASAARYELRADGHAPARTVTHVLSGSVAIAREPGPASHIVTLSASPLRGRAGIAGRVFLDRDADGSFDSSDQLLRGVSVIVGSTIVETDSAGEYRMPDAVPYSTVTVSVDSLTLPSQDLVVRPVRVMPLPNGMTRVDLPVARSPESGFSVQCLSGIGRLTQNPQGGDTTPVHRDDFQSGSGDAHPITHPRQPAQSCEDVSAQR